MQKYILETINFVMGPFSITSKNWGEFNFVIGGSRFVLLHHLALSPLPLVDGKFPSQNRRKWSRSKINWFLGGLGQRDTSFSRKSSEKGPKKGQILQN